MQKVYTEKVNQPREKRSYGVWKKVAMALKVGESVWVPRQWQKIAISVYLKKKWGPGCYETFQEDGGFRVVRLDPKNEPMPEGIKFFKGELTPKDDENE